MGIGRLVGGKFNLVLSIRHDASAAVIDQWRASWERASQLLFDATDGQHQLGDIYVCNRSSGGRNADAWLLPTEQGDSSTNGWHEIGHETFHMTLFGEERFRPFVLVHEFGHYAYGCDDEYKGPTQQSDLHCIGGTTSNACIMEGGFTDGDRFGSGGTGGPFERGRIRAFCVASNHRTSLPLTNQQNRYGHSCWQTMVANFPTLTLPAGLPAGPGARVAVPINWRVLAAEQRFVLVLDRSGSMAGQKIEEARIGADWWPDAAAIGERLGVVSFGSSATANFPLRTIGGPPDRAAARAAISGITAGGSTSIGDGLRIALNQILAAGPRAATQVAVLVSDGFQNSGENPSAVVPDLVTNGVRVYTIGVGPDIDIPLLTNIANSTGGSFRRIDPTQSPARQATDIREELIRIAGLAHDNGGVVTTIPERPEDGSGRERQSHTAFIERGSELATFVVTWPGREDHVELELVAPDGTTIGRGTTIPGVHEISGEDPYMGFQVAQPEPGDWTLLLTPERVSDPDPFTHLVFSQNPAIDGGVTSPRSRYKPGASIPLNLQVYYQQPLTKLKVIGVAHLPGGGQAPLDFVDDGSRGDALAYDGLYSTVFDKTERAGVYRFEVDVQSDDNSVAYRGPAERHVEGETFEYPPIPSFRRRFEMMVAVGAEGFEHPTDPDHLDGHMTSTAA